MAVLLNTVVEVKLGDREQYRVYLPSTTQGTMR